MKLELFNTAILNHIWVYSASLQTSFYELQTARLKTTKYKKYAYLGLD